MKDLIRTGWILTSPIAPFVLFDCLFFRVEKCHESELEMAAKTFYTSNLNVVA